MQSKIDQLGKLLNQTEELDAQDSSLKDEIKMCGLEEFFDEQYPVLKVK